MITVIDYNRTNGSYRVEEEPKTKHTHEVSNDGGVLCRRVCGECGHASVLFLTPGSLGHANCEHLCTYKGKSVVRSMTHADQEFICVL